MSEEKITFENKITTPFTWVENDLLRSKSLSLEAIGLYMILRSFGGTSYPSVDYLCSLGKTGRDRLWRVMNELIAARLLLRKQEHRIGGKFSKTIYRIISLNDSYEEIYKEFIGEELEKPQTLDNSQSQPCTEKPCTVLPCTENPTLIRIIDKEESFKEKKHTQKKEEEGVCENKIKKLIEKIKEIKLYRNSEAGVLENLITRYGEEVLKAAIYIEDVNKKITVRNPEGLLITTLRNKLYSEIQEDNKNNNINADIEKLNMQYRGLEVYENEKITEIANIGGRIAYRTDNIMREFIITKSKNIDEFREYIAGAGPVNDTS
jgi:hypothetical protein